jgi:hypothetical protein
MVMVVGAVVPSLPLCDPVDPPEIVTETPPLPLPVVMVVPVKIDGSTVRRGRDRLQSESITMATATVKMSSERTRR